jgi:hypothetical protein
LYSSFEMNDPGSPSHSEAPPAARAQSHSAAHLHSHPLWQQAAGKSRSNTASTSNRERSKKSTSSNMVDNSNGARYERISLLAVELQQGATGGDGADSTLLYSDDEDRMDDCDSSAKRKHDDEADYEYEDEYDMDYVDQTSAVNSEDENYDFVKPKSRTKKRVKTESNKMDIMAAAAFGKSSDLFKETSDNESVMSRTSSNKKRDAYKNAFPVKGVSCVGCALANRIAPVERFVNTNVGRMSENALWKMAALTWMVEVVKPSQREGVNVVDWSWRDIANHFRLHTTNSIVGRTHMIQSLTAMRCQVEQRLVRVENGERELDKINADLCLKVNIYIY